MSIQDDMYDVEAEVKGTGAEQAFANFANWASQLEVDLELVLGQHAILINAFKLINNKDEINKEFEALNKRLKR